MSYSFSPKDPDEQIVLSFNFAALLGAGETILSCVFTALNVPGWSDNSSAMILGGVDLSGAPIVKQMIKGGVDGQSYLIKAEVITSIGRVLVGSATLLVRLGA